MNQLARVFGVTEQAQQVSFLLNQQAEVLHTFVLHACMHNKEVLTRLVETCRVVWRHSRHSSLTSRQCSRQMQCATRACSSRWTMTGTALCRCTTMLCCSCTDCPQISRVQTAVCTRSRCNAACLAGACVCPWCLLTQWGQHVLNPKCRLTGVQGDNIC